MSRFKLQVQDDDEKPEQWRDVRNDKNELMVFESVDAARATLAEMFPLLVKMESFAADRKRTRVVVMNPYQDIDEEKES